MHESHRDDPSKGPRFLRFYCCLGPLKRGWRDFCRPVVFLDARFLKGAYKGQLFTAIGMDQNDGWWPIAWGVAEAEGYVQWKWFLELLDVDLQLSENSPRYVFMSDQQKGLGLVIAQKYPQSEHRFCVQHMYNNFNKRFLGDKLRNTLWEIAGLYSTIPNFTFCDRASNVVDRCGIAPSEESATTYFAFVLTDKIKHTIRILS